MNLDKTKEYRNLLIHIIQSPTSFPKELRQQSLERLMDLDRRYMRLLEAKKEVDALLTVAAAQAMATLEKDGGPCH
jgi:hypothetical protein